MKDLVEKELAYHDEKDGMLVLEIIGIPGSGKSILSSYFLSNLEVLDEMSGVDEQDWMRSKKTFNDLCICGECTGAYFYVNEKRIGKLTSSLYTQLVNVWRFDRRYGVRSFKNASVVCMQCNRVFSPNRAKMLIICAIDKLWEKRKVS